MKAVEVAAVIESIAPIASGMPGDELGFIHGDPATEVSVVVVCWSASRPVIEAAVAQEAQMIVSHEPLFFQKRWSVDAEAGNEWFDEAEDAMKPVNVARRQALDRAGICVYRAHSNWDVVPEVGIIDSLIRVLELGPPVERGRFTSVHQVAPVTVRDLAARVRKVLQTGPLRVTGALDRTVTRIGTLIGGLGQMFNSPEEIARLGAECVIAGECLAYTLHDADELGLALIEAGHCASEMPGMRAMADRLAKQLPGVDVQFVRTPDPWGVAGA